MQTTGSTDREQNFRVYKWLGEMIDIWSTAYKPGSIGPAVVTETVWPFEVISTCKTLPISIGSGAYTDLLAPGSN